MKYLAIKMNPKLGSLILGALFFVIGLATLTDYGINWDTINHLPRGQAYLHFFLTGKRDFSDLDKFKPYWQDPDSLGIKTSLPKGQYPSRSIYQSGGTTFNWFLEHDGNGHPPVSDILSAVFNTIFFQKLRLINDIDSYRLYGLVLSGALIALVSYWSYLLYGRLAGFLSGISLALYPLFFAESHFNNEKDIPETAFWSFMLFFGWLGFTKNKPKFLLISGLFFGLALGTKFNILFAFFAILPWLFLCVYKNGIKKNSKLLLIFLISLILGFLVFILLWPYLWADPVAGLLKVLHFYKSIGLTEAVDKRFVGLFNLNTYPLKWILTTTPIVTLVFFLCGAFFIFRRIRKEKNYSSLLILLWFFIPLLRVSLPGTTIYGGIRQIMEYIPAMAIIAGLGGSLIKEKFSQFSGKRIGFVATLALFLPITFHLIQIHPNENVYFNPLIGGLKGAMTKNIPSWGNSFGGAYRRGVFWIDKNAETHSKVVLAYELLPNIPFIWMRNDLDYHNSSRSGYLRNGEYSITLTYQGTKDRSYYDMYLEKFQKPVYQSDVDGVPVMKIWKNDDEHLIHKLTEKPVQSSILKKIPSGLSIDLGSERNISRLEIRYDQKNCLELKSGTVRISKDTKSWTNLPGTLPNSWRISALGKQPSQGNFIEPFVGQRTRYIDLLLTPPDTCLSKVKSFEIFELL